MPGHFWVVEWGDTYDHSLAGRLRPASRPDLDGGARLRRTHLEHPRWVLALTEASTRCRRSCSGGHLFLRGSRCTARGLPVSATARSKAVLIRRLCLCQFRAFVHDPG